METEELLEKMSKDMDKSPRISQHFLSKQSRLSEILQNFALVQKNEIPKAKIQENIRDLQEMFEAKIDETLKEAPNNISETHENKSFDNRTQHNILNKENLHLNANKEERTKKREVKHKDDVEYEEMVENLKYLEKYLNYQEGFYNEILNEQRSWINLKSQKMKYMDETKLKILEIDKIMEADQERTIRESAKYNEIIGSLEEEKQNLEKLLEEEQSKLNQFSEILQEKTENCNILKEKNEELLRSIDAEQELLEQKKNYSVILTSKADELLLIENNLTVSLKENLEKKKFLNNELQELKGNIRVYCRIRPFLNTDPEIEKDPNFFIITENNTSLQLNIPQKFIRSENNAKDYKFYFEHIFPEISSQQEIFNELSQLIQSALDGYNVCVFAYGQTGSGKTFTMEGGCDSEEKRGIIPRGVEYIFQQISYLKKYDWDYNVYVSFQEIYMDQIRDLLKDIPAVNGEVSSFQVESPSSLFPLLKIANQNRKVAETFCNERSSRSHSIFQLKLQGKNLKSGQEINGTLNLIDLAGSERLSVSKAEGDRLKETQAINKSLTSLGDVITALANKEKHIPYRNSKLTYTLQNYLGGDSKTLMFVNVSPYVSNFNQTLCSLRFADKVKKCKIGVAKKHIVNI